MVRPSYEIPGFSFGGCKVEINRQATYGAIRSWFRNSLEEEWFECCTRSNIVSTSIMIQERPSTKYVFAVNKTRVLLVQRSG